MIERPQADKGTIEIGSRWGHGSATGLSLPSFLIIGAMRAGTTYLMRNLDEHPEIYMSPKKEIHFFDENFHRGVGWYSAHFKGAKEHRALGEATPIYMFDERVPSRMSSVLPNAKLVAILRNPVDRAYSHYWQKRSYGKEPLGFADAIAVETHRISAGNDHRRLYSYRARGRYREQLVRFCKYYRRDSLLISLFEEMRDSPAESFSRICRFLGVDDSFVPQNLGARMNSYLNFRSPRLRAFGRRLPRPIRRAIGWANSRPSSYPKMDPTVRAQLLELFRNENTALAAWSGLDLSAWER